MARSKRQYGSGCLLQRGKGWAIRWREFEIAPDGSRTKVLKYEALGEVTRKQAQDTLSERIARCAGGKGTLRSRVPFRTVANEWREHVLPMYKHSTQKNHRHILDKHLLPWFGDKAIADVTRQEVQMFVSRLAQQGYAPRTIDHLHDVLSAVLRTAVKWGHLSENPTRDVELPKLRTVRPKWALSIEQAQALIDGLSGLARTMVGLAILSGVRRGELFALRWQDVAEDLSMLHIRQAVYEGTFDTPKTEAGVRRIPLSSAAQDLLRAWRDASPKTDGDDLLFATWSGKPISPNNVLRRWVFPACDALGLTRASWLTFRRTYSSWAHDKGVPGKVLAQLMGHAKVDTTLNIYTQVLDGSVRAAAGRVGSELITIVH